MTKKIPKSIEILIVGNELLNGTVLDTNSHWLSQRVRSAGGLVSRKTTVGDNLGDISSAIRESLSRKPSWLFCLGGLGPTYDDMTLEGVAAALGVRTAVTMKSAAMLKENINRRRLRMGLRKISRISKSSLKMARIPAGAKPLRNGYGSAPGVLIQSTRTKIVCLPGVPPEMKAIFTEEILPGLQDFSTNQIKEKWFRTKGLSESRLAYPVRKIVQEYSPTIYIKSHPIGFDRGKPLIDIQIIASSPKEKADSALKSLDDAERRLKQSVARLGGDILNRKGIIKNGDGAALPHWGRAIPID
jgi:nicotinamide-nucleotide amidase